jgi:hypothetical protein
VRIEEADMAKKDEEEIKVVDRRRFTEEGDERGEAPPDAAVEEAVGPLPPSGDLPPVDFITFVLSFSQTAFLSLGLGPHPETGKPEVDLRSARWTIEALEMIHEKTRGNLSGEEERIFDRVLAELRMAYVQVASAKGGKLS